MIEYRLFIYVVFLYIFTNSFTTCFSNSFIHADSINIKATLVPLKINTYNHVILPVAVARQYI